MSFSLHSMVRLVVLLTLGSTLLAIGVSRLDPPRAPIRTERPVTAANVNDCLLNVADRQSRWIDSETGRLSVVPIGGDDVLEAASCSPWVDDSGHRQMVGRWSSRTYRGPKTLSHGFGLGRFSYPDGRPLNQVVTDRVPISPPCWVPGTQARILFTSGDGQLYHFNFEPDEPGALATSESPDLIDARPIPLVWDCPKPGRGEVFFGDVSWPVDPRMGGRLLASLRTQELDKAGVRQFTRSRLWWLKLEPAGTRITAAGLMLDQDETNPLARFPDDRVPTVAGLPDGSLGLAYIRTGSDCSEWSVRLTTLRTDATDQVLAGQDVGSRILTQQGQPGPLAFSPDGRWLNVLVNNNNEGAGGVVARFATLPSTTLAEASPPARTPTRTL